MFDQNRYNCYKIQGSLIACCFIPNHIDYECRSGGCWFWDVYEFRY